MKDFEKITIRFSKSKLEQIDQHLNGGTRTSFIRNAVDNLISSELDTSSSFVQVINRIKKLDTNSIEQKVNELAIGVQIIFEEIKKQNEALALIHRRSTLAAGYGVKILDDIKQSEEFSNVEQTKLLQLTKQEMNDIQLTIKRK